MKKMWNILFFCLLLISIFIFMFILNYNTALVTDDFVYQFVFENRLPTVNTRYLSNIIDIFISMINHWNLWGGRVVVHFLLQLSFLFGIQCFNVVNSIMFILLGILIYKHIDNFKKINFPLLILIYSVLFLFIPQPGATIFWKSGSANYLWSSVIMLCMTLMLKNYSYDSNYFKDKKINIVLMFFMGVVVGNLNENSGCALIVCSFLYMIFYRIKNGEIPKWIISGILGLLIGYIVLLISPGNYIRADEMYPGVEYGIVDLIEYALKITRLSYDYLSVIIISAIVTSVMVFEKKNNLKQYIICYGNQFIFWIFVLASIYSLIFSPAYPERCWTFPFIYLVIIIGINIKQLQEKRRFGQLIKKIIVILMLSLSIKAISEYNEAFYDIIDTKICIDDHVKQINNEKNNGNFDVVLHTFPEAYGKYNAFTYNGYLTFNSESWTNRWIAEYYGLKSIVGED